MKFRILFLLVIAFTVCDVETGHSQMLFYVSIQGNWDKQRNPSRAQFGADNKLINAYFKSFARELLRSGGDIQGSTGEVSFRIDVNGNVDSMAINKKIGEMYDVTIVEIIQNMSGKWRAGQVDGVKQPETLTLWYNIYKGPKNNKTLEEFTEEGKKSIADNDFKKALRQLENALKYDELNLDAILLKAQALAGLNRKTEACEFVKSVLKFNNERINESFRQYCE